jgi:hypothetical protein
VTAATLVGTFGGIDTVFEIAFDVAVGVLGYAVPALVILAVVKLLQRRQVERDDDLVPGWRS